MTTLTVAIVLHTAGAAVYAASSTPPVNTTDVKTHRATVPEDSGKWRREPFIGADSKKNKSTSAISTTGKKSVAESLDSTDVNLQGIMQVGKAFHALINGHVVKTGDKLDGITVAAISRYQVIVQNEKKEKRIYDIYQGRINRGIK